MNDNAVLQLINDLGSRVVLLLLVFVGLASLVATTVLAFRCSTLEVSPTLRRSW